MPQKYYDFLTMIGFAVNDKNVIMNRWVLEKIVLPVALFGIMLYLQQQSILAELDSMKRYETFAHEEIRKDIAYNDQRISSIIKDIYVYPHGGRK